MWDFNPVLSCRYFMVGRVSRNLHSNPFQLKGSIDLDIEDDLPKFSAIAPVHSKYHVELV